MAKRKQAGLPTMERAKVEVPQQESRPEVKVEKEPPAPVAPASLSQSTVVVEIDVLPALLDGPIHISKQLNMSKRLTTRQAKALKSIVNLTEGSRHTQAMQILFDKIADAIEEHYGMTL